MANATVLYVVPADEQVRAALEERVSDFGAEVSGNPERVGEVAEIELEDCDDPIDDLDEIVTILKQGGVPYFGRTGSFTERSRGLRCEARMLLSGFGVELTKNFPWSEGEPEFDERSMRIAGFDEGHISAAMSLFLTSSPAPKI